MANPIGQRNLLLGILALQRRTVREGALVAAMNAWADNKAKGLGQILREQNALSENDHAVLEELVDEHLARHGNNLRASLAAVCLSGAVRDELEKIADPDLHGDLAGIPAVQSTERTNEAASDENGAAAAIVAIPAEVEVANSKACAAPQAENASWPTEPAEGHRRMPSWMVILIGCMVGAVIAIGGSVGAFVAVLSLMTQPAEKPGDTPIVAAVPKAEAAPHPPVPVAPPTKNERQEAKGNVRTEKPAAPPAEVKPTFKPAPPPIIDNAPMAAALVVELPQMSGPACLTPDGSRVIYPIADAGRFGYREAPAFDVAQTASISNALTPPQPLASSADGQRLAFTADTKSGPKVFLWHWGTRTVEASFPVAGLGKSCVFSPDGKYLATHGMQTVANGPVRFWMDVHECAAGRSVKGWALDGPPAFFGFTPDGGTVFFAAPQEETARSWNIQTGANGAIPFSDIAKKHFFSNDFTKFACSESPTHLLVGFVAGLRKLAKITPDDPEARIQSAAFSSDTRLLLVGLRFETKEQILVGRARLIDLNAGANLGETPVMDGIPERIELAPNGLALLQGSSLKPRIYHFATGPGRNFVKVEPPPPPPTPDFVQLFNGRDLSGWKHDRREPGNWRVENGLLVGSAFGKVGSRLYTEHAQPAHFHLRVEARVSDKGAGAVLFRCEDGTIVGYEAPVNSTAPAVLPTGSLHAQLSGRRVDLVRAVRPTIAPDRWFILEIIAEGPHLILKVDGQTTADLVDQRHGNAGHLALLQHAFSKVEFRRIEIKPLTVAAPAPLVAARPFAPLFNGKDLTSWQTEGNGVWKVIDGELVGQGPNALLVTQRKDFKSLRARIELSASADTDAFIALRENPAPGTFTKLKALSTRLIGDGETVSAGYAGQDGNKLESGYQRVKVLAGHPIVLDIQAKPGQFRISTNGKPTGAVNFAPDKSPPGAIGLHIARGTVRIRKFDIVDESADNVVARKKDPAAPPPVIAKKELPAPPPIIAKKELPTPPPAVGAGGDFVPLYNGKDLAGWQPHARRPGNWRVDKGVLVGSAPGGGALYTTRGDYQDFHLRAEARINAKGFGRLLVRAAYDSRKIPFKVVGYEVLINQRPVGGKTGALTATSAAATTMAAPVPAPETPVPVGEWLLLEILARGETVTVMVNGKITAAFVDQKGSFARSGHIALHQDAKAVLEFRKVEIRDLMPHKIGQPPAAPAAAPPPSNGKGKFTATFNGNGGKWRIEGEELIQNALNPNASIFFGDAKWRDFDFSVSAKRTAGNDHFALWYRAAGDKDAYIFAIGGQKNTVHMAARIKEGAIVQISLHNAKDSSVVTGRWHVAKISVRGERAQCYLDGVKLFEFTTDEIRSGSVGLRTSESAYRFKHLKVTAPDGTVLMDGMPEMPSGK